MPEPRYYVTVHAATRYRERVKPALEYAAAKQELEDLVERFGEITDYPGWTGDHPRPGAQFLSLLDGLGAIVMDGDQITTVVTRGGMHPDKRAAKNERRAIRKAARLFRSKSFAAKKKGRRPDRSPNWEE